jgi:hypothetical protein
VGLHFDAGPPTIALINGLGSLRAIAISHPHFYTTMVEWSRAFGGIPIHLHADDRRWIMRPDPAIQLWNGETLKLMPDLTLIRWGGTFEAAPSCIGPRALEAEGYYAHPISRR